MFILNPDLEKISRAHIERLLADQVPESKYIEYKSAFGTNRSGEDKVSEKIRLLAGLSSFANTAGGDFLLGIRAEDGLPREIVPLNRGDLDQLKLTIEQLVQTGVSPRINPGIHEIRISENGSVLLVRIAKSWISPHRVTIAGHDKFYGRHSAGKYPMDLDQLRAAFAQSSGWNERLAKMRDGLLATIAERTASGALERPWVVLHMIPYEALDPMTLFDLSVVKNSGLMGLMPLGQSSTSYSHRFNLEGLLASVSVEREDQATSIYAYTQFLRNGIIESVDASTAMTCHFGNAPNTIFAAHLEAEILKAFRRFLRIQQLVGVAPPIVVFLSMLGVREYTLRTGSFRIPSFKSYIFDRENLLLPGVTIDSFDVDRVAVFKPIFDVLWNAGGRPRCEHYTEDGSPAFPEGFLADEMIS